VAVRTGALPVVSTAYTVWTFAVRRSIGHTNDLRDSLELLPVVWHTIEGFDKSVDTVFIKGLPDGPDLFPLFEELDVVLIAILVFLQSFEPGAATTQTDLRAFFFDEVLEVFEGRIVDASRDGVLFQIHAELSGRFLYLLMLSLELGDVFGEDYELRLFSLGLVAVHCNRRGDRRVSLCLRFLGELYADVFVFTPVVVASRTFFVAERRAVDQFACADFVGWDVGETARVVAWR
jgi:hypothetical protein